MFCVEDEFYFLFHCPVYSDLRNNLFEKNSVVLAV